MIKEGDILNSPKKSPENLEKFYQKGAFDLSQADKKEQQELLNYLKNSFDQIDEDIKSQMLEQFVGHDLINDSNVYELAKKMSPQKQEQLGLYIGKTIEPNKYIKTFHQCFQFLKEKNRQDFIKLFTEESPQYFLMVAPFHELRRLFFTAKGINKIYYNNQEKVSEFLENAVFFAEGADFAQKEIIKNNIKLLFEDNKHFFYPYLKKLADLSLLEKSDLQILLDPPRSISKHFYTTKEEQERKEIYDKIRKQSKIKSEDDSLEFELLELLTPTMYARQLQQIEDNASDRLATSVLGNFYRYKDLLDDPMNFLFKCIDSGVSIFSQVQELKLTKTEIQRCLTEAINTFNPVFIKYDLSDIKSLLEYGESIKDQEGKPVEDMVFRFISKIINEQGDDSRFVKMFVKNFESIIDHFSPEKQKRIINLINSKIPHAWSANPGYVLENNMVSLSELLKNSAGNETKLLDNYSQIISAIQKTEKNKEKAKEKIDFFKKKLKKIISVNPVILSFSYEHVINELFTKAEVKEIILQKLISVDDQFFVYRLMSSELAKDFLPEIKIVLEQNPQLFCDMLDDEHFKIAKDLLGKRKTSELIIENLDKIDFWMGNFLVFFIDSLQSSEILQKKFFEKVDSAKNFFIYNKISKHISTDISYYNYSLKENTIRKKSLEAQLSNIRKKEIELRQGGFLSEIQELKKKEKIINQELEKINNKPELLFRNQENVLKFQQTVDQRFEQGLLNNKFAVFDKEILELDQALVSQLVEEQIDEYCQTNPEILSNLNLSKHLSKEHYERLIQENIQFIAFNKFGNPGDLSDDLKKQLLKINPLFAIESEEKLEQDFYHFALEKLSKTKFFKIYKKKLEKIARQENDFNGPQHNPSVMEININFKELADRLFLLDSSKIAVSNKDKILELPLDKQEEFFLKIAEFLTMYQLDDTLEIDLNKMDFEQAIDLMMQPVNLYVRKVFQLENEEADFENFDIDLMKALSIYYKNSCEKFPEMKNAFQEFLQSVLSGNYLEWRTWGVNEHITEEQKQVCFEQMQTQELLPEKMNLEQYEIWNQTQTSDFEETLQYEISDISKAIKQTYMQAVADGHVPRDFFNFDYRLLQNKYESLMEPMKEMVQEKKELVLEIKKNKDKTKLAELNEKLKELNEQISNYRQDTFDEINRIRSLQFLHAFKNISADDLQKKVLTVDNKKQISLKEVFKILKEIFTEMPDFATDISKLQKILHEAAENLFSKGKISKAKLKITDEVNLKSYFLIGEKPVPSCQSYNGSILNQGLLSYVIDPNVRIIQIYDEDENIVARSVLRLLSDKEGNPALYLERIYTVNTHEKIYHAIKDFAKSKAEKMGVLYYEEYDQEEVNEDKILDRRLYSKNSRSPFVYTDAGGGKRKNGKFEVRI